METLKQTSHGASGSSAPIKLRTEKSWRPAMFAIGLACVIGSLLLGWLIYRSVTKTTLVLVTVSDIEAGDTLEAADLVAVEMVASGAVELIEASTQDTAGLDLYGQLAAGPIPAGTPINADMFVDPDELLGADEVIVAIEVNSGVLPDDVKEGDRLQVIGPLLTVEQVNQDEWTVIGEGVVRHVEPVGEKNRTVTMVLNYNDARNVIAAHLKDEFHVVIIN